MLSGRGSQVGHFGQRTRPRSKRFAIRRLDWTPFDWRRRHWSPSMARVGCRSRDRPTLFFSAYWHQIMSRAAVFPLLLWLRVQSRGIIVMADQITRRLGPLAAARRKKMAPLWSFEGATWQWRHCVAVYCFSCAQAGIYLFLYYYDCPRLAGRVGGSAERGGRHQRRPPPDQ